MRIVVSLLVVLVFGSVWLSSELDTLRQKVAVLEGQAAQGNTFEQRLNSLEAKLENPFLDQDYQQLLGLLQSYLIDSHRYQELFLQHTQTSLSLLLSPNRSEVEKRKLAEQLERIKKEAMVLDATRKKTFQAWQDGMEKYEQRIASEQQGNPGASFDERVLDATKRMRVLKQQMNEGH